MSDSEHDNLTGTFFKVLEEPLPARGNESDPCRPLVGRTTDGKAVMARYHGEIGAPCLGDFKKTLENLLSGQTGILILDFFFLSRLSHSAAGVLVSFAADVLGRGKKLYLYRAGPQAEQLLSKLAIKYFFDFLQNEDDLIAVFPLDYAA